MKLWQIKIRAFLIHLFLSALVISFFLLTVTQLWYPGALFEIENVWEGLQILIPIDAILGPILTLILFVPGKKGLKIDLSIVAALQISALVYGGSIIYGQRPVLFAFVVDRFEIIPASKDYLSDIPMGRFKNNNTSFPLMSYVLPPQSLEEGSDFIFAKVKFDKIGERHYPISAYLDKIAEKSLKISRIKPKNKKSEQVLATFKANNQPLEQLLLLRLQASTYESIILVLNAKTGKIIQYLNIDSWSEYSKLDPTK